MKNNHVLTIIRLDKELYFYVERTENTKPEFSQASSVFYFERINLKTKEDTENLISNFSLWVNIPDYKVINKRELKKILKVNFPLETKFY